MTKRIVTLGELPPSVLEIFQETHEVVTTDEASRQEALQAVNADTVLIIARGSVLVDAEIMDLAPGLLAVSRTGVGYDSVSIEDATERGLPVLYTPGAMTRAVAEHTLGFILTLCKRYGFWRDSLQRRDWLARYHSRSLDLEGKTLGIIGYGRIGSLVHRLVEPLRMKILVDDPYIDHSRHPGVHFVGLEEALRGSDILTLHVPLNEDTRGMIDEAALGLCRPGTLLVNTARGAVVESLDLLHEALESSLLGGVAIDVFPDEPPPWDHPLLEHPHAVLTGHVAARTPLAQQRILETMLEDVQRVLAGKSPRAENVVNPEVLKAT